MGIERVVDLMRQQEVFEDLLSGVSSEILPLIVLRDQKELLPEDYTLREKLLGSDNRLKLKLYPCKYNKLGSLLEKLCNSTSSQHAFSASEVQKTTKSPSLVYIQGDEERNSNTVKVKNMKTRQERIIRMDEI